MGSRLVGTTSVKSCGEQLTGTHLSVHSWWGCAASGTQLAGAQLVVHSWLIRSYWYTVVRYVVSFTQLTGSLRIHTVAGEHNQVKIKWY
jgi:hypothetical protein